MNLFLGKYRGKVVDNNDPNKMGRLQITVPQVLGKGKKSWAMPCVPYAGKMVGLFALPPKDANIWVEFEGGDPDYPIWSGCFWGSGEMPQQVGDDQVKAFLQTDSVILTIKDKQNAGGLFLEVKSPGVKTPINISADSSGVTLKTGDASVKITANSIGLDLKTSAVDVQKKSIDLNVKPKSNVNLSTAKVSINKTALEVV